MDPGATGGIMGVARAEVSTLAKGVPGVMLL